MLGFIVLLAACQEDTIDPEMFGKLSGRITHDDGRPMPGVLIATIPPTSRVMTDSLGDFLMEEISVGEYTVTPEKAGYTNETANISVSQHRIAQLLMTLQEKAASLGALQGTLLDALTNTPVSGASITTFPPTVALITDQAGQFAIDSLPKNDYTVLVKKAGYAKDSVKVAVAQNKTTQMTLLLEPQAQTTFNRLVQVGSPMAATRQTDSVTLRWKVDNLRTGAILHFDVLLYEPHNPAGKTIATGIADTSVVVTNLAYNTTYFWQVVAKDQYGNSTLGELWSFQTMALPDIHYLFNRRTEGNQEIYGADETLQHKIRLTHQAAEEVYPRFSPDRQWIAYVSNADGKQQLYVMRPDGTEPVKVTELPVAGYHNYGEGFCWSPDGGQLLYSHYNKLYRINRDGTGLTLLATAPEGRHFKACDWSGVAHKIVVQTVGVDIYDSEFYLMNEDGSDMSLLIDNVPGRLEYPSFSIDGKQLLFTQDVSGFVAASGRQLDARIFLFDLDTKESTSLSGGKPTGTNDTHPCFSPDGAYVLFENSSNEPDCPMQ